MTTKVQAEFLAAGIISDQTQVSAADADHLLIFDASDNSLKKALVSTITSSGASAADDITAGDAAVTISTSSGNITIDNGSSDDDIIFKGTDGGSDITALTLDMSDAGRATFNGSVDIGGGLITRTGDLTLDVSGVIVLDADNAGVVQLKDGGSHYGSFYTSSDTLNIQANINNADINFIGKDDNTNITALTLDMSEGGSASFNHDIQMVDNGMIRMGAGGDLILLSDGTNGTLFTNNGALTLDSAGNIDLDADSGSITFKDDGLLTATLSRSVGNFEVTVNQSDGDFVLKGNDGGSPLTAITVDMSNGGEAIFYGGIDIAAGTDIELNDGTWTGEKARKIQAHSGHIYYQSASHVFRNASGNNVAQVDGSGNFVALANVTAYGSPSDIKLKEDIEVIDNAVDKVKQLKGVTYTLKSDGNRLTGLIAQDLEKVLPEAVYTSETIPDEINGEEAEEHLAIRYGNTVGLLVEAIKELSAKIEKLENK